MAKLEEFNKKNWTEACPRSFSKRKNNLSSNLLGFIKDRLRTLRYKLGFVLMPHSVNKV